VRLGLPPVGLYFVMNLNTVVFPKKYNKTSVRNIQGVLIKELVFI